MKRDAKESLSRAELIRRSKFFVLGTAILVFAGYFVTSCGSSVTEKRVIESPFKPLPENIVSTDEMDGVDFSSFKHDSERHRDVPCLLCHQQKDDLGRPQFSSHTPCAGCHTPQFKDKTHLICTTCHTESDSAELKPFPAMASFRANFNHSEHIRTTTCASCHKPQGSGMTVPSGGDAHTTCFTCHTSDKVVGDKNIGSCNTCHELGRPNRIVDSTAAIGFNFDHAKHGRVACDSCHSPAGVNKMSATTVSQHKNLANSCATCHNSKRAFGASRMADCRRCHVDIPASANFGVRFSHAVHAKDNCASCHKAGAANFSVPSGATAHNSCFQCHSPGKSAAAKSTCFSCHNIGGGMDIKPSRAVIPGNFAHAKHEFMGCDSCHAPSGVKMTMPTAAMHKAKGKGTNCATCHDNQTAFGGEDFASCKRCHVGDKFGR